MGRWTTCTVALSSIWGALICACSATTAPPKELSAESLSEETTANEEVGDEEAALLAQIEESAEIADLQAEESRGVPESEWQDEDEQREVVYRMSNDGLKVEVLGAEFVPRAEGFRVGGGYGLRLTVTASTAQPLVLYAPVQGPLAFAGRVKRGQEERFRDAREGGISVAFEPKSPIQFERSWPGDDGRPLMAGEELELHVGLWGLGTSDENRRPVHRFLVVKMTATQSGAMPRIEPPTN